MQHGQAITTNQIDLPKRQSSEQANNDKLGKRTGMKSAGGGGIVQVQGGHILRSTGRKDRHSKVYTAKGPRDRRVRLSAQTAIQFYDVQDQLGYDRPSKAVDWLMKKAKNAIDKLDELPPWNPNDATIATNADPTVVSSGMTLGQQQSESSPQYAFQQQRQLGENSSSGPPYMQPSVASQPIAETMRLFLPSSSGTSSINFQNYPQDIMSRVSVQTGDLCLSLHSLHDPNSSHTPSTDQALFSSQAPLAFDANYPRLVSWSGGSGSGDDGDSRVGFIFNSQSVPQQPLLCQSPAFSQREPLQSTYSHLIHAWSNQNSQAVNQSSVSSSQFASEFHVPAQVHGGEELRVASNNPSSASASSHR